MRPSVIGPTWAVNRPTRVPSTSTTQRAPSWMVSGSGRNGSLSWPDHGAITSFSWPGRDQCSPGSIGFR